MKKVSFCLLIVLACLLTVTAYAESGITEAISSDGQEIVYIPDMGGKVTIYLNGQKLDFDKEIDWFMTKNNFSLDFPETFVPIRAVCEKIGYVVGWDQAERIISITDPASEKTITITPESTYHNVNMEGHYYLDFTTLMQKLGLKCEGKWFNTLKIYKVIPLTENEKVTPAPLLDEYPAGIYKVGVDIPAGDYLLRANESSAACLLSAYKLLSAPHSLEFLCENPMVPYEGLSPLGGTVNFLSQVKGNVKIFEKTYIVTLNEGEYCELVDCAATVLKDETAITGGEAPYSAGAYRIGADVPEGEYVLIKDGEAPAYDVYKLGSLSFGLNGNKAFPFEHTIIALKTGTFFYLKDCAMYPSPETSSLRSPFKASSSYSFPQRS